jgi:uracil-DNA glycosylase
MLQSSWGKQLKSEFEKNYMKNLNLFLTEEIKKGKKIYPKGSEYYSAFNLTPFESVKVVILGQDPYHGPGQAHGLCFSVPEGTKAPPSLVNIFKELKNDIGREVSKNGCLEVWARQGVLLLNSVLTVEAEQAASHQKKGWEIFTDEVIKKLNDEKENLVFILWGSYAQKKAEFVNQNKHFVIKSVHPSPLSSHRGFFGSKPFSKTNDYLIKNGIKPIEW